MRRVTEATISEADDYIAARRQQNQRARLQRGYSTNVRASLVRCLHGQRVPLSYYAPDSTEWSPPRPTSREHKTDEARFSRKERRDLKRVRGLHQRTTWLAQNHWSLKWTTCGEWILGPPLGTWAQHPRSKGMRQREARRAKKTMLAQKEGVCEVTGKPCQWRSEEWQDEQGNIESWDNFCLDCGQWQNHEPAAVAQSVRAPVS